MADVELKVEARETLGKEEAGRMRRAGKVPGVVYGPGREPKSITADPAEVIAILKSKIGKNTILTLKSEDKALNNKKVMIREHQVNALTDKLAHIDLMEIAKDRRIKVRIPIELTGRPVGLDNGGTIDLLLREIEISCMPDEIPESIPVDISHLDIGNAMHVKDVKLEKFKILSNMNLTFVTIAAPQKEEEVKAAEAVAAVPGAEGAEGVPAEGAEGATAAAGAEGEKKAEGKGAEAAKGKGAEPAKGKGAEPAKGKEEAKPKGKGKEEGKGKK